MPGVAEEAEQTLEESLDDLIFTLIIILLGVK